VHHLDAEVGRNGDQALLFGFREPLVGNSGVEGLLNNAQDFLF
jgi:hypothetical protein